MRKHHSPQGEIHRLVHHSRLLEGNRLNDPAVRPVYVYTPHGYDPSRRYPLMMDLVGYTGTGASHLNWKPFGYSLPERLDRLIETEALGPVIVVLPDCYTCYGGNQYIDSTATGPYMSYLIEEIIPFVEENFSVLPGREHRAVFGKSSGGYGALMHAMMRADVWGAAACHSGDLYFEYCYLRDFPVLLDQIRRYGTVERFLEAVWSKEKLSHGESHGLMALGMAAHYDPDPEEPLGFHLPFNLQTGEIRPERWANWLRFDPVRQAAACVDHLMSLRALWIDCGQRDQYHLLWGARMLHERLQQLNVRHTWEEFDDDHSDIDYRMNRSLPFLYEAIRAPFDEGGA